MKKILIVLITSFFLISFVFSYGESHCWRQDISRGVSPNIEFSEVYLEDPLVVPMHSSLKISGFDSYHYYCDNGASGNNLNYYEVYDLKNNKVIATNSGPNQNEGPARSGGIMCYNKRNNSACYIDKGQYFPGKRTCNSGPWTIGKGNLPLINIDLSNYMGEQEWVIRLGAISPYGSGIGPGSEKITFRDIFFLDFLVSPPPSLLVFPPAPLQKLNSFDLDGNIVKDVHFTLLNKSNHTIEIKNYSIECKGGLECFLETNEDGSLFYEGYPIDPDQAMAIPVKFLINKNDLPLITESILSVSFLPKGTTKCINGNCLAKSVPVRIESGFLDQQDFQINVINQQEQKYCVNANGKIGVTGEGVLPKINLYFGGDFPVNSFVLSDESTDSLISLNECSPIDYNTGLENPDWIYCTQKEFLVQLADRIDLYYTMLDSINSLESLGRFKDATPIREKLGLVSSFSAYLRAQNLHKDELSYSINALNKLDEELVLSKIGLGGNQISNDFSKFSELIKSVSFNQYDTGVRIDSLDLSPGEYKINIEIDNSNSLGTGLFVGGKVDEGIVIKVNLEKKASPKLDWFFYYEDNDFDELLHSPSTENIFVNNYLERGKIMSFTKKENSLTELDSFYSTYAVPLIIRVKGPSEEDEGKMDSSNFSVSISDWEYGKEEDSVFSVWSGFASSLGSTGCESTVKTSKGKQGLPYRIIDSLKNTSGTFNYFEIKDLNELKTDSVMYLSTVLYLPKEKEIQLRTSSFDVFTINEELIRDDGEEIVLIINKSDYENNLVDSLNQLFQGIREENICVSYDNSLGVEEWEIFWNQDKILEQLDFVKKKIRNVTKDATICETSELKAS